MEQDPPRRRRKKRLSKSDYQAGLQCAKHLWLRIYEPDAIELERDKGIEALLQQGKRVGEMARSHIPGGRLIDKPFYAIDDRLQATKRAIEEGEAIIYEAAFAADGMFVAIDILTRVPEGFIVTEVKSSTSVHDPHLQELALQAHILGRCGIGISRLELMHLNRDCEYPNLNEIFSREDVTERAQPLIEKVEEIINSQARVLSERLPSVQIGAHCLAPYECPFKERCWADVPLDHVTTLHSMRAVKAFDLVAQGFATIQNLPEDFGLSTVADRQRRAVLENRTIVESTLAEALQDFTPPMGFLDFETVAPAIPVWNGCHPYETVPVQFSYCLQQPDGTMTFSEWLADGPGDPREQIAMELVDACGNVGKIAAYNSGFELSCLRHLAKAVPRLAVELESISQRLVDLLPVVRDNVYHPALYGSFGLKRVFPVLTSQPAYENLQIADGSTASWLLQRLLFESGQLSLEERSRIRRDLLQYCKTDTECLPKLLSRLRELQDRYRRSESAEESQLKAQ